MPTTAIPVAVVLAKVDYPAPDINLDYTLGASSGYSGYDKFGRVKDHFWDGYNSTADVSRIKYGYDFPGNRTWREDIVAAANSKNHDELYDYDGLFRLTDLTRGNLTGSPPSPIGSKLFAEDWTLDALGNWSQYQRDTDADATWELSHNRTHNAANELTEIADDADDLAHDAAGNMTKIPVRGNWAAHYYLTYDAWNRLIKVKSGTTTIAELRYDGLNRRTVKYDGPASSPTATYAYYYNEDWQVLEVREDGVSNPIEQFIWHPYYIDAPAVRFYDANTLDTTQVDHYYQQDANFNVVAVTNSSGAVQERYNCSAYGDGQDENGIAKPVFITTEIGIAMGRSAGS